MSGMRGFADSEWLVALDVDGTILHEDETLAPQVTRAVRAVRDAGHEVILATGRGWQSTREVLEMLELAPEYVVSANGALIMRRDEAAEGGYLRHHVETFDPRAVLQRIREHLPTGRFLVEDPTGRRYFTEGMFEWDLRGAHLVDFDRLADTPVTRVVCVSPDHSAEEFLALVTEMGLHSVSYSIGYTAWLDIAPDGVNKATALERVRQWYGVPGERVFVAGDGRNDLEMLTWARELGGRAVAMGQAPDDVRAVASEITGSVLDDGLIDALAPLLAGDTVRHSAGS